MASTLPTRLMSPVAVIVMVRAPDESASPQISPVIVTKPFPELVKASLLLPDPLLLTAAIVAP